MRILINDFCGHAFPMELSRELARRGHTVLHVYFADNHSTPKGQLQIREDDPAELSIEGLHISRKFSKHSILTRRQSDIEYGSVTANCVKSFRPDVVLSGNMPLNGQEILMRAAHSANARFVFWLQDVYCLAAYFVLQRKSKLLAWAGHAYFKRLEKRLLKQSDAVICISQGFVETIRAWGVEGPNVHLLENWAPLDEVKPLPKDNAWANEQRVANEFCFVYSGTLGMKHRPELLLELARYLERNHSGKLIVVAAGAGAEWLHENANAVSSDILKTLPFQPYDRISEVLSSADVLITLLDSDAGDFAVPSKTLSYLCAGRAQIVAAPTTNEAARAVKRAEAGTVVSPDDPNEFLEAAKLYLKDRMLCMECGRNGRAYAERTFNIGRITDRILSIVAPNLAGTADWKRNSRTLDANSSIDFTGTL